MVPAMAYATTERGLTEVVLAHVGRDAALEVAVAREDARELHVTGDRLELRLDFPGVSDAAHAAKAARKEAQLAERFEEARTPKDELRSRGCPVRGWS